MLRRGSGCCCRRASQSAPGGAAVTVAAVLACLIRAARCEPTSQARDRRSGRHRENVAKNVQRKCTAGRRDAISGKVTGRAVAIYDAAGSYSINVTMRTADCWGADPVQATGYATLRVQ